MVKFMYTSNKKRGFSAPVMHPSGSVHTPVRQETLRFTPAQLASSWAFRTLQMYAKTYHITHKNTKT